MAYSLKEEIIQTAGELFMTKGYIATSTREIAKILDVSQPAIYHHFKNKETLYIQVLKKFATKKGKEINEIINQQKDQKDILIDLSFYLTNGHPINLTMMLSDMKITLSRETQKEIFLIWNEYYFSPIQHFFDSFQDSLKENLTSDKVSRHFLRQISSYLSNDAFNLFDTDLEIKEMVEIFYDGITKKT